MGHEQYVHVSPNSEDLLFCVVSKLTLPGGMSIVIRQFLGHPVQRSIFIFNCGLPPDQ
jgi:hypothetical protein